MLIRDAVMADAAAIAAIRERTIRTIVAPLKLYSTNEIESWAANYPPERVATFIEQGNCLVAEEGGRVVGFGRLHVECPGLAKVRGVFVDAESIGRGIGSQIMERLLAIAEKRGVTTVELVATLNARRFYERLGFRRIERVAHTTPNGAVIPGFHMRCDIMTRRDSR